LDKLCGEDVAKIYISFDDLYCTNGDNPYTEDRALIIGLYAELVEFEFGFGPPGDENGDREFDDRLGGRSPWEVARSIGTNYNVALWEQDFLIAVDRYLVSQKRNDFLSLISNDRT
jgi:hypothetical protein